MPRLDSGTLACGGTFTPSAQLGLTHGRGVLTPYAGLTLGDGGPRTMRTGLRWQVDADVVFGLEGTRRADSAGEGDNEVRLRAALRF